jgi:hypothetical protein
MAFHFTFLQLSSLFNLSLYALLLLIHLLSLLLPAVSSSLLTDCRRLETSHSGRILRGRILKSCRGTSKTSWCCQDSSNIPSSLRCILFPYELLYAVVTYVYNLDPLFPFSVIILFFQPSFFKVFKLDQRCFKELDLQKFLMSQS